MKIVGGLATAVPFFDFGLKILNTAAKVKLTGL